MVQVLVFLQHPRSESQVELSGLTKRLNAIGLQPIPGDEFKFADLKSDDVERIRQLGGEPPTTMTVLSRQFAFEDYRSVMRIYLGSN